MTTTDAHVASPEQEAAEQAFERGGVTDWLYRHAEEIGVALAEGCAPDLLAFTVFGALRDDPEAIPWLEHHGCADLVRRAREAYVEEATRR